MKAWLVAPLAIAAAMGAPAHSRAQADAAAIARALIAGLACDEARRVLVDADAEDPNVALERARLSIYELDCDGAAAILARPELQRAEAGEQLADIARGCQRVIAALVIDKDVEHGIEVRWQDEHDRALAPILFDTIIKARDALTRDLGVDWPRPTRVVVVRDLLSLSAMTGLPYKSAQTTGTVAVAKWGRVTILTPRASRHGYPWRDTLAHEMTHLAVTRASQDRAPLWLQEGVAKREEVRWRDVGPFDNRPPPEAVVLRGQNQRLSFPLDKLGPSIAMLPSADAATVAFAEVTSFVRFYVDTQGPDALARLLAELKTGKEADEALLSASGTNLKAWDGKWRAYIASYSGEPSSVISGLGREPGKDIERTNWRDRSRLAELLLAREHASEALVELGRVPAGSSASLSEAWAADPSACWLRARALEGVGRAEEGQSLMADPKNVLWSHPPWWALRGRWARLRGDEPMAIASFAEAVASDPFDEEAACESIGTNGTRGASGANSTLGTPDGGGDQGKASAVSNPATAPLCDAARMRREPPFHDD